VSGHRLPAGGIAIDRARPVDFTFDGTRHQGFAGDTLASALMAAGHRVLARSFRYHRPRGLVGAWVDEPNVLLDVRLGEAHEANAKATLVPLADGLAAKAINAWPSVRHDLGALADLAHGLLPAGFYYKTFQRPSWHAWEGFIRSRAGLGKVDPAAPQLKHVQQTAHCDVLVVGGGPAGLAAALAASAGGARVILADDRPAFGGALALEDAPIDGEAPLAWAARVAAALAARPDVTLLPATIAVAYFDHNLIALVQRRATPRPGWAAERLWRVRARRVVLATGALERPLVFPGNDRPGVMLADAALQYARRYGVMAGTRALMATNNDTAYAATLALADAGLAIAAIADSREDVPLPLAAAARERGIAVHAGHAVVGTSGRGGITGARVAPLGDAGRGTVVDCDLVLMSGGWNPTVHLFSQSGGKLRYDEGSAAFVPDISVQDEVSVGACRGAHDTAAALAQGHAAGQAAASAVGHPGPASLPPRAEPRPAPRIVPLWSVPGVKGRQWVDLLNDVTTGDVALAARENYASVEHLKRYTTLGMGTDQGKTSNVNGLAILAGLTGRAIPEVGTTTFRPPYVPVTLGALAGQRRGTLLHPVRRLPAHDLHESLGAAFDEYGGWMRPAWYARAAQDRDACIAAETLAVRRAVGLFDGSPLGKIEVQGRDAARFLDLIYYTAIGTLQPGRVRYAFLLNENGKVFDDGVVARLGPERFLLSPSSSHAAHVYAHLEEWRQCEYPQMDVRITNLTTAWATLAVTGPRARAVLARLDTSIATAPAALPHMAVAEGTVGGAPARIARVSFTGELSFEISVPAGYGAALWRHLMDLGAAEGIAPFGLEALMILRMEKGYILIGVDTDGNTEPQDLGLTGPLRSKQVDFVGRRSLLRPISRRTDRLELVGLAVEGDAPLPPGAHALAPGPDRALRSLGYVSSSAMSPALGHPVALGLIEGGRARQQEGQVLDFVSRGARYRARVVAPTFYDPEGKRLHG